MLRYAIVIEKGNASYGAYVPDLPGCVAAADSEIEVRELIREVIPFHIEGLRLNGDPVPQPTSQVEYVEVEPVAD
jgi:predicted RNase H-like HicB family nuclease